MHVYETLPNGVNIVEYDHSLAQAVADMWNASGDSWGGDLSVRTAADTIADISGGSYLNVYLAEKDGVVLGYASLSKYYRDDDALYLHVLNVRPDYHGHKLGKALVLYCVNRTIELGYPRLDIHTWPGNTKSVPLYKKCGYMWEDRVDSTHLVNFIPTVLKTEASRDFFGKADWYTDNTRVIEVKPDGVKHNEFEMFRYAWAKDGRTLSAGFERTGRRMRLLETDDYRVEMTAESHELAFGLAYRCTFDAENKTGKPLHIQIQGKDDGNICFDYTAEADVTGTHTFEATFVVNEITEPQDIWRVHPCVLADVRINGLHAAFGLGIETKWPVSLEVRELKKLATPGAQYDCYFNLTSALRSDASVMLRLPETAPTVLRFDSAGFSTDIPRLGRASVKAQATTLRYGYEPLPITYDIKLADGRSITYVRPYHSVSRGLTGLCSFETETDYIIQNGPWQLGLNKNSSYIWSSHARDQKGGPGFPIGQLGRPYSDEFGLMKPVCVRMERCDDLMVLAATYHSNAYKGAEYTEIVTLAAAGVFTRYHRVTNTGTTTLTCVLKDESHPTLGRYTVLPHDGGIQTIRDGLSGYAHTVDVAKIDENWLYEDDRRYPNGICWPPSYKLNIRWSECVYFEHDITLEPGAVFETEPVTVVCGHFFHWNDFRDFARQTYTPVARTTTPHLDWTLNGGNPFAAGDTWAAEVIQYRSERLEGAITVSAGETAFTRGKDKGEGEGENRLFTCPASQQGAMTPVTLRMALNTFEKDWTKALFTPNGKQAVRTSEQDGVFVVENGVLTFKADPRFSDACYSLAKDGHEWMMSHYPSRAPYAWFNPFIGGFNTELEKMRDAMTIREPITAAFAEERDALGNVWKGIATTVTVQNFDTHKGLAYTQYYLTLPGLPVLCYLIRLHNGSGLYKRLWLQTEAFFGHPSGDLTQLTLSGTDPYGTAYRFRAGSDSRWRSLNQLATVEADACADKLYVYRDTADGASLALEFDRSIATISTGFAAEVANGGVYTSKPMFMLLTPETLNAAMLTDLDNITFA